MSLNIVQPIGLLKTVEIEDVDAQQTLMILPAPFLKQFSLRHFVTFQEVSLDTLLLTMVPPGGRAVEKTYRLVTSKGSSWVSVPRSWLRNLGAEKGDTIALHSTANPKVLLVQFRKRMPGDAQI